MHSFLNGKTVMRASIATAGFHAGFGMNSVNDWLFILAALSMFPVGWYIHRLETK